MLHKREEQYENDWCGIVGLNYTHLEYIVQKLLENVIQCSLFPKTDICIYCQVICDDGSLLSTILNSVMLALADSEIPLTTKYASVSLLLSSKGEILPDPCKEEEQGVDDELLLSDP